MVEAFLQISWIPLVFAVFLLLAVLYDQETKRIPSRLHDNQAPRSRFGLVRADAFGSDTTAYGVE